MDALDQKILDVLRDHARASYSEIGEQVGLSRVAVKNRIAALEKNGIIQGYKTIINEGNIPQGVKFTLEIEAIPVLYTDVVEALKADEFLRELYSTTGQCRLFAIGFAPNTSTVEHHVNELFERTKGIRRLNWHFLMSNIKDENGGVDYARQM